MAGHVQIKVYPHLQDIHLMITIIMIQALLTILLM